MVPGDYCHVAGIAEIFKPGENLTIFKGKPKMGQVPRDHSMVDTLGTQVGKQIRENFRPVDMASVLEPGKITEYPLVQKVPKGDLLEAGKVGVGQMGQKKTVPSLGRKGGFKQGISGNDLI